ncbi:MAG: hypothetical protein ABSA58_19215 [Acetobacteraceae bacterium]
MSGTLERRQAGAPFTPWHGSNGLRHVALGTWWERVLSVVGLAFVLITVVNIVLRGL